MTNVAPAAPGGLWLTREEEEEEEGLLRQFYC